DAASEPGELHQANRAPKRIGGGSVVSQHEQTPACPEKDTQHFGSGGTALSQLGHGGGVHSVRKSVPRHRSTFVIGSTDQQPCATGHTCPSTNACRPSRREQPRDRVPTRPGRESRCEVHRWRRAHSPPHPIRGANTDHPRKRHLTSFLTNG